jgi:hypothetical protein
MSYSLEIEQLVAHKHRLEAEVRDLKVEVELMKASATGDPGHDRCGARAGAGRGLELAPETVQGVAAGSTVATTNAASS